MSLLEINNLATTYADGTVGLAGASLAVSPGELVVILGHNGSGKSTLLRSAIRLIEPTSGTVHIGGTQVTAKGLREVRRKVGFVLQSPSLVKRRSVLANVATGALGRHRNLSTLLGRAPRAEFAFAAECLNRVGLLDLAWRRADQLSGGQAQRVAIARSLCQQPLILFADEPVASLDPEAADEVLSTLRKLVDNEGLAVVVVLHQPELALRYGDRIVGMRKGLIAFDQPATDVAMEAVNSLYVR